MSESAAVEVIRPCERREIRQIPEGWRGPTYPGRPKGVKNGEGKAHRKPIVRWTPRHDQIVLAYINGATQTEIARAFGLTRRSVGRVVFDPKAKAMIKEYRERARQMFVEVVRDRLLALGPVAVDRIEETIRAQFALDSAAKRHQDLVSFKVLGILDVDRQDGQGKPKVTLDRDVQERLVAALEKSNGIERSRSDGQTDEQRSAEGE
jgi:hypothetical protein